MVCGLQYVGWFDRGDEPGVELLAAPVMAGARCGGKPIYFSDVVVRADSPARSLLDVRGRVWGYNEPTSHSGYALTRSWLATQGFGDAFFGALAGTGAHLRSFELLLDGQIDGTAIDSTVLETELRSRPALSRSVRVVQTLGPSPIPPVLISRAVPESTRAALRSCFLQMHLDPLGKQILADAAMLRFVPVHDQDYAPIRTMSRLAGQLGAWDASEGPARRVGRADLLWAGLSGD